MSWKPGASLGTFPNGSQAKASPFSAPNSASSDLPRFWILGIFVLVVLIIFIVWVMVIGWATATEAAAYGVLGALAIAGWSGGLSRATFAASLMGATRLSCMIMFILAGIYILLGTALDGV